MIIEKRPKHLYHNQEEAIHQLLERGETITLSYVVTEKEADADSIGAAVTHG